MNKKVQIMFVMFIQLLSLACATAAQSASQAQGESETSIPAETDPAIIAKKPTAGGLGLAMVGISLGAFGAVAYLKFSHQRRSEIKDDIDALTSLAEGRTVTCTIITSSESDQMQPVFRLLEERRAKISALEATKKQLLDGIAAAASRLHVL